METVVEVSGGVLFALGGVLFFPAAIGAVIAFFVGRPRLAAWLLGIALLSFALPIVWIAAETAMLDLRPAR